MTALSARTARILRASVSTLVLGFASLSPTAAYAQDQAEAAEEAKPISAQTDPDAAASPEAETAADGAIIVTGQRRALQSARNVKRNADTVVDLSRRRTSAPSPTSQWQKLSSACRASPSIASRRPATRRTSRPNRRASSSAVFRRCGRSQRPRYVQREQLARSELGRHHARADAPSGRLQESDCGNDRGRHRWFDRPSQSRSLRRHWRAIQAGREHELQRPVKRMDARRQRLLQQPLEHRGRRIRRHGTRRLFACRDGLPGYSVRPFGDTSDGFGPNGPETAYYPIQSISSTTNTIVVASVSLAQRNGAAPIATFLRRCNSIGRPTRTPGRSARSAHSALARIFTASASVRAFLRPTSVAKYGSRPRGPQTSPSIPTEISRPVPSPQLPVVGGGAILAARI